MTAENNPDQSIQQLLGAILKVTINTHPHFTNREQDEILRYAYCGLDKSCKIAQALITLYPSLDKNPDMELPMGILLRSVLMDAIIHLNAKSVVYKFNGENGDDVKKELAEYCFKVINDGTAHFLGEIYGSPTMTYEEKHEKAEKFVAQFKRAFEKPSGKFKLKKEYRFTITDIAKQHRTGQHEIPDAIYNLYSFYSKYDHVSHYTSLTNALPEKLLKGKIKLAIWLMARHVRDLLALAFDFGESMKNIEPMLDEFAQTLIDIPPSAFE